MFLCSENTSDIKYPPKEMKKYDEKKKHEDPDKSPAKRFYPPRWREEVMMEQDIDNLPGAPEGIGVTEYFPMIEGSIRSRSLRCREKQCTANTTSDPFQDVHGVYLFGPPEKTTISSSYNDDDVKRILGKFIPPKLKLYYPELTRRYIPNDETKDESEKLPEPRAKGQEYKMNIKKDTNNKAVIKPLVEPLEVTVKATPPTVPAMNLHSTMPETRVTRKFSGAKPIQSPVSLSANVGPGAIRAPGPQSREISAKNKTVKRWGGEAMPRDLPPTKRIKLSPPPQLGKAHPGTIQGPASECRRMSAKEKIMQMWGKGQESAIHAPEPQSREISAKNKTVKRWGEEAMPRDLPPTKRIKLSPPPQLGKAHPGKIQGPASECRRMSAKEKIMQMWGKGQESAIHAPEPQSREISAKNKTVKRWGGEAMPRDLPATKRIKLSPPPQLGKAHPGTIQGPASECRRMSAKEKIMQMWGKGQESAIHAPEPQSREISAKNKTVKRWGEEAMPRDLPPTKRIKLSPPPQLGKAHPGKIQGPASECRRMSAKEKIMQMWGKGQESAIHAPEPQSREISAKNKTVKRWGGEAMPRDLPATKRIKLSPPPQLGKAHPGTIQGPASECRRMSAKEKIMQMWGKGQESAEENARGKVKRAGKKSEDYNALYRLIFAPVPLKGESQQVAGETKKKTLFAPLKAVDPMIKTSNSKSLLGRINGMEEGKKRVEKGAASSSSCDK